MSLRYAKSGEAISLYTHRHCEPREAGCGNPRHVYRISFFISALLLLLTQNTFAQSRPYTDQAFYPYIKTVEFYNAQKQASFPLINLNSSDKLLLGFDDLHGGTKNYHYSIEHCDENWNSSNLSPAEFATSFNDDVITNYNYSTATRQKYTHYEITFPNDNIRPKIAGNYIVKVYEDGSPDKPILIRRFYVLNQKVAINAQVVPSADQANRQTNQKINFDINYAGLQVQNPGNDLHTIIMQNARPETAILNTQPAYIRGTQLQFNDVTTNDFAGRNEFRHVDLRSLKLNSDRVAHIYLDTANVVILLPDAPRTNANYTQYFDLNGNFYPGNQDNSRDVRTDGDYAQVAFTFQSANLGDVYILGQFNNYRADEASKMHYDDATRRYNAVLLLKQGVYDYEYARMSNGKLDDLSTEGNHVETENDYQLLIYYHPPSARWTELVGYKLLNTANK